MGPYGLGAYTVQVSPWAGVCVTVMYDLEHVKIQGWKHLEWMNYWRTRMYVVYLYERERKWGIFTIGKTRLLSHISAFWFRFLWAMTSSSNLQFSLLDSCCYLCPKNTIHLFVVSTSCIYSQTFNLKIIDRRWHATRSNSPCESHTPFHNRDFRRARLSSVH